MLIGFLPCLCRYLLPLGSLIAERHVAFLKQDPSAVVNLRAHCGSTVSIYNLAMVDMLLLFNYLITVDIFLSLYSRLLDNATGAFTPIEGSLPDFFSSLDFMYDYVVNPHGLAHLENIASSHLQDVSSLGDSTTQSPLTLWALALNLNISLVGKFDFFNKTSDANPAFAAAFSKFYNTRKMGEILLHSVRIASNEDFQSSECARHFVHTVAATVAGANTSAADYLYWKEDLTQGYSMRMLLFVVRESLTTSAIDLIDENKPQGFALSLARQLIGAQNKLSALEFLNEATMHSYRVLAEEEAQDLLHEAVTQLMPKIDELQAESEKDHMFGIVFGIALLRAMSLGLVTQFDLELIEGMESSQRDTSENSQPAFLAVCEATIFAMDVYISYVRGKGSQGAIDIHIKLHGVIFVFCEYLDWFTRNLKKLKATTFWTKAMEDDETSAAAFQVHEALLLVWATVSESLPVDDLNVKDFDYSLSNCLAAWNELITCVYTNENTVWTSATSAALHRTIELSLLISISKTESMLQALAKPSEISNNELLMAFRMQCIRLGMQMLAAFFVHKRLGDFYEAESLSYLLDHRRALLLKLLYHMQLLSKIVEMPAVATREFSKSTFIAPLSICLIDNTSQLSSILDKPNPTIDFVDSVLEDSRKKLDNEPHVDPQNLWEELRKINSNAPNGPLEDILRNQTEALNTLQCSYVGCTRLPDLGQKLKRKLCAACQRVHYCCAACQKKDWKSHKQACKLLGKLEK